MQAKISYNQKFSNFAQLVFRELKRHQNVSLLHLEIKYGIPKKIQNKTKYNQALAESIYQIVSINGTKHNKQNKFISTATNHQYSSIQPKLDEVLQKQKFSLNFGQERYSYLIGRQQWFQQQKKSFLTRQSDIIWNKKHFRCDLSYRQVVNKNAIEQVKKKIINQPKLRGVMRFKSQTDHYCFPNYRLSLMEIYQSDQNLQDFYKFKKAIFGTKQDFQHFYFTTFNQKKGVCTRYEIQLRFIDRGIQHIKKLQIQDLTQYLCSTIKDFQKFPKPQFKFVDENAQKQ